MLISVQVYSCNHHYSIALACTGTGIKTSLKKKKNQEKSLKRTPAVGVMQMQKLRAAQDATSTFTQLLNSDFLLGSFQDKIEPGLQY